MLILVALFLFGANDVADQEKMIITFVIVFLLVLTTISSFVTILIQIWKHVQSSLKSNHWQSNIEVTNLDSFLVENPVDSIQNTETSCRKFVSRVSFSFVKELLSYELFLYSKFQGSTIDSKELHDLDQMSGVLKNLAEVTSVQLKFYLSLSYPLQFT